MPNLADARQTYSATLGFIPSRAELPVLLNERRLLGCGVEVGVKEGEFSEHILRYWRGAHLISVDPWLRDEEEDYVDIANLPQAMHNRFYRRTLERLAPFGARSSVWRATSLEAAQRIPHHSLDFVYLDARHDHDSVLEDLEAWFDKVRPGGIIAGHDYVDGHLDAGIFGVRSAVDGFFAERELPVYATLLDEPWISWVVEIPLPEAECEMPEEDYGSAEAQAEEPRRSTESWSRVTLNLGTAAEGRSVRMLLDPEQMTQRSLLEYFAREQLYEPETSHFLLSTLRPGDTFVDVGAHVGFFSLLAAAAVGPGGRVVCFEPNPDNYTHLQENIGLNDFTWVSAVQAAVADRDGQAALHMNLDNDGGHALWEVGRHGFNRRSREAPSVCPVEVVRLDHALAATLVGTPRMLKVDAEGAETQVLLGALPLLEATPIPYVICEVNRFALEQMGSTEVELRALMTGLGYETFVFIPGETTLYPLKSDEFVQSDHVFNLLFRHPSALD